ncbi:MAG TPA: alpha/beta hydrolase [Gemmatimonadaceae bacterium]|nr:alpha/beta hydrolase [Gemmatimonadaceae bacterium]
MVKLLVTVALAIVLALLLLRVGHRRLIYFPYGDVPAPSAVGLAGATERRVTTEDGVELRAWYVPPRGPPAGFTVIVFHGNAGNRSHRAPLAAALADRGAGVVLFDYRGYGENAGRPSEEGLARDARAVRDHVASWGEVDSTRLVYHGESLGAAVALRLAMERPPLALVLRSPFTSLADAGRFHYPLLPVGWLLRDRYPSIERVGGLTRPLLVIAGGEDEIVPVVQSERLYAAAPEPKRLLRIDGLMHNDYELLAGDRVVDTIVGFVAGVEAGAPR